MGHVGKRIKNSLEGIDRIKLYQLDEAISIVKSKANAKFDETVEIAIRGALTGHLVFSTLHTNDAVGGISRLLDMGIEPFMISSSVRAFQAQRLVRTLCPFCKQPNHYEDSYLSAIGFPLEWRDKLCRPVGCRSCRGTGFSGRLAIMEICLMSEKLQEKINSRATAMEFKAQALLRLPQSLRRHHHPRRSAHRHRSQRINLHPSSYLAKSTNASLPAS